MTPKDAVRRPVILLIHGTGASTHSWRGVLPLLAQHAQVLAVDLPGHAFTGMPAEPAAASMLSLPAMSKGLAVLLQTMGLSPGLLVGHSAGAAIAVRMALDGHVTSRAVVSINGALLPPAGPLGSFFSPVAKVLAAMPFVPGVFSRRAADPQVLQRLLDGTGSRLDAAGAALYGQLVRNPSHAAGALGMMAQWDLSTLVDDLHRLTTPLHFLVGSNDRTVPPEQAQQVNRLLAPCARRPVVALAGLGHLAQEERPDLVSEQVLQVMAQHGLSSG